MRWIYYDPDDAAEARERHAVLEKIDLWWKTFASRTRDLEQLFSRKQEWDLPAWMAENLQSISPRLMWEFGPAVKRDGHRLVITPESEHGLRPIVKTILERAPKLDGWEFYPHRIAEDFEWAMTTVDGRAGVDISDARVVVKPNDGRLDLSFTFSACHGPDDNDALGAAFIATESLLGEDVLEQWLGLVDVAPARKKSFLSFGRKDESVGLRQLQSAVREAIQQLLDARPSVPCIDRADSAEWSLFQMGAVPDAFDYPAQSDMRVGKSMDAAMWIAARRGRAFFSESFSRFGETFCYVKVDGVEGLDESQFDDKGDIEDALDEALRRDRIGCFIGGGTGQRYAYVDLALTDVTRGADIIRRVLQEGNITRRCWLLFYDASLSDEWIGIWPDTPPPPVELEHTSANVD